MLNVKNLCRQVVNISALLVLSWPCGASTLQQQSTGHFLAKIAILESSNGKNTNHRKINKGIHKSHRTLGVYCLMPNTIEEIIRRGKFDTPCEDSKKIKQCEYIWASFLGTKLLKKLQNPEMAAYAWFYGHNLSKQQIIQRNYKKSFYVKRFNKL